MIFFCEIKMHNSRTNIKLSLFFMVPGKDYQLQMIFFWDK